MAAPWDGLVVATHNRGKRAEYARLLAEVGWVWEDAAALGVPEPDETGDSFEANACLKAEHAAGHTLRPAIADDTGLCVEAWGGRPGIHTKRWAMAQGGWDAARRRLAERLGVLGSNAMPEVGDAPDVRARFVCAMSLACPEDTGATLAGSAVVVRCETRGRVVWPPRGDGPGFVPVFVPDAPPLDVRGVLSHRRGAFEALVRRVGLSDR